AFASRPSRGGFSGTAATRAQGSGAWHMARTQYAAYRPSMLVEGSILGVIGDVFSAANRRDPHPLYHRLRAEEPMAYAEEIDEWVLTRWADCEAVLRDPRWSSSPEHRPPDAMGGPSISAEASEVGLKTLLFLDPPDHTRLRRLVS